MEAADRGDRGEEVMSAGFSLPVFGEGRVGSASATSREARPHPTLPEDGEGKGPGAAGFSAR
jgi:hypothetical protein